MKGNTKMTKEMEWEYKRLLMVISTWGNLKMVSIMAKATINHKMAPHISENGMMI